jgi:hypothetical protein
VTATGGLAQLERAATLAWTSSILEQPHDATDLTLRAVQPVDDAVGLLAW